MAVVQISDIIQPEVFTQYVQERTAELANFRLSGILSRDQDFDLLATRGGNTIKMPYFQDLTGSSQILSDSSPLSTDKITTEQDVAVLYERGNAWRGNDLAATRAGADPMLAIANRVAEYWLRDQEQVLISTLTGVFNDNIANDSSDMVVDVSGATNDDVVAATKMSRDVFIDGQATFGDRSVGLAGIAMHSTVYHNLKKLDTNTNQFIKESEGDAEIETYQGLRIIVDDTLPFTPAGGALGTDTAPFYTSYLFGTGSIALGQGGARRPTEVDRFVLEGDDILVNRSHFLMHPRGVKFTSSSVAASSPANSEAELAVNWDRVWERKNVRLAAIITNG